MGKEISHGLIYLKTMKLLILRVQRAILRSTLYFSAAHNSRSFIALLNHKLELYQTIGNHPFTNRVGSCGWA